RIVANSVKPGNARVPEGGNVTIEARVAGAIPLSAKLQITTAAGKRSAVAMRPDAASPDLFRASVPAGESFEYRITAGDGRSAAFTLDVVRRPQIESLMAQLTPPAYTHSPAGSSIPVESELGGIAGTMVELTLVASKPLKDAKVVAESGQAVELH